MIRFCALVRCDFMLLKNIRAKLHDLGCRGMLLSTCMHIFRNSVHDLKIQCMKNYFLFCARCKQKSASISRNAHMV